MPKLDKPTHRVWRPNYDETEQDAANREWIYIALDAEVAAELHADFCHKNRDGWEWSWPQTFRVKEIATGKEFDVEVDREMVPEFVAGKAKERVPNPCCGNVGTHSENRREYCSTCGQEIA